MTTRNKVVTLAFFAAILFLAGCAGPAANTTVAVPTDCIFPDSPKDRAPDWVCDTPVEGVEISAVGIASPSAAGPGFMKDVAAANARAELARQLKVHVKDMVKRYVETTGAADSETVDKLNSVVDKQVTDQFVTNSRIFRSTTSPEGSLYVLVGLDPKMTENSSREMLNTSYRNDNALWQQFRAKQGFDELREEILSENPQNAQLAGQ